MTEAKPSGRTSGGEPFPARQPRAQQRQQHCRGPYQQMVRNATIYTPRFMSETRSKVMRAPKTSSAKNFRQLGQHFTEMFELVSELRADRGV